MTRAELAAQVEVLRRRVRALERRLRQSQRAGDALRQSEARFRSLFEYAEDMIVSCRLDGTITGVNRVTEQTVGWSREELVGQNIARIVTPASVALGQERVRRALAGEKIPKIFELEAVCRDGRLVPVEGWARFIRDAEGRPAEHLGVFRDIGERRRAEETLRESEERYRSLFDNANDSIMTFTLDGTVLTVNRAYERLTGWTGDELIGKTWWELIAPADRARMEDRTRRALAGEKLPSLFEVGTLCKDGRVVPLEGRTRMRRDHQGRPIGFQGIYRDITERKRAEEALRESEERSRAMFAEAEARREIVDRLYRLTASMQASWDPADRLRAFVQGVHEILGFDRFYVALASPDSATFDVAAAVGVEMFERLPLSPAAGPLYHAFATRQPLAILTDEDLRRVPPVDAEYRDRAYFRSRRFIVVPLVAGDRALGVASADNKTSRRPITAATVELFSLVCQQLATALEEARLYAEARAREQEVAARNRELTAALEQQTATSEILRVISSSPTELQPVLDAIAESATRLCEALDAAVFLRDRDVVVPTAHFGPLPVPLGERQPLNRRWVTGRAVLDGKLLHVTDLTQAPDDLAQGREMALRSGHRATLSVPLLREGAAVGAILVRRREARAFSDKQVALIQTFADQATIAIENTRLFEALEARNRELMTALDQQTATGEILRVISSSPTDIQPVCDEIVRSTQRLLRAYSVSAMRLVGDDVHLAAYTQTDAEGDAELESVFPMSLAKLQERFPAHIDVWRGAIIHQPDVESDPRETPSSLHIPRSRGFKARVF